MRLVEVARFGGPEVLVPVTAPDPAAGERQVVIRVSAADVLFLDAVIRYGLGVGYFPGDPPRMCRVTGWPGG
jgi:NADPH:quinone reductase